LAVVGALIAGGSDRAIAEHSSAGGHGVQLECDPNPFVVRPGDTVTVTYVVRNTAGVPGNAPDHDVTYTLTDEWVGDVVNPGMAGTQSDTLDHHQSASAGVFSEGDDQRTYVRTFVFEDDLDNAVMLSGDFDDDHSAQASVTCNLELGPTPTPSDTPTSTLVSEVSPTTTAPLPTPTPTRITEVLGPPTGDGTGAGLGIAPVVGLIAALVGAGASMAALGYRRIR
jgi:hypothetical protein